MLEVNRNPDLVRRVAIYRRESITDTQADMMLHAIGADNRKERMYLGRKIYHAYRNYYDAGGEDDLTEKGYATKVNGCYHLTPEGLQLLELLTDATIYNDYSNVADCREDLLTAFMKADVYCGYGCWFPASVKGIARSLNMPLALARETARELAEEGLLKKGHCGGIDDEGYPYCVHGYYLTQKARECDKWEKLKKAEYEYIEDEIFGKENKS